MKNLILMFITILLLANYTSAQDDDTDFSSQLMFGLKIGANYSNVYDAQGEEFNADAKFGLAAGAFASIPLGEHIGVQPEILFSQKGFQATGRILGSTYSFTRTTNYIDVPLLFAVKPLEIVTILVGPQFSYLMRQKDVFTSSIVSTMQEQEFKNENIRKNTLCFLTGIDVNITHLVIGARVGWDILNNNGNGTSSTPRYKNTWVQATLGYRF